MQRIAEYYLAEYDSPRRKRSGTGPALALGAASSTLYGGLYVYSGELVELAEMTRDGERVWFLVPIAIAFLFSLVHGAFTGRFWDLLGLKARH